MSYVTNDVQRPAGLPWSRHTPSSSSRKPLVLVGSICAMVYLDWQPDPLCVLHVPGRALLHGLLRPEDPPAPAAGSSRPPPTSPPSCRRPCPPARVVKSFVREPYEILPASTRTNTAELRRQHAAASRSMATLAAGTIELVAALGVTADPLVRRARRVHRRRRSTARIPDRLPGVRRQHLQPHQAHRPRASGTSSSALAAAQRVFSMSWTCRKRALKNMPGRQCRCPRCRARCRIPWSMCPSPTTPVKP
jgi:hypothetical protein